MKLKIYFKSGNIVTARNVNHWEVTCKSGSINGITIGYEKSYFLKRKVIVKSINLDNIDCIIEV